MGCDCKVSQLKPLASGLVQVALGSRRLAGQELAEGISTRMLIAAARLVERGLSVEQSCELCLLQPLTDDRAVLEGLRALVKACLP